MNYNQQTRAAISRGDISVCIHCNDIIREGVYINNELCCEECAKQYMIDRPVNSTLSILLDYIEDIEPDMVSDIICSMSLDDFCRIFGSEMWYI